MLGQGRPMVGYKKKKVFFMLVLSARHLFFVDNESIYTHFFVGIAKMDTHFVKPFLCWHHGQNVFFLLVERDVDLFFVGEAKKNLFFSVYVKKNLFFFGLC